MSIVSVSLDDESIRSLDRIVESMNLKGRSDAVRLSIRSAVAELKELENYEGLVEGVMIIVHEHHNDSWISIIQHVNEDIIKTQLHSHLQNKKCLELMIISGNGDRVSTMLKDVHSSGKATYVKFVRS